MRATANSATKRGRIIMNTCQSIADWPVSLCFVMLSPLLGILVGMLVVLVFLD